MNIKKWKKENISNISQTEVNNTKDLSASGLKFDQLVERGNEHFGKQNYRLAFVDFNAAVQCASSVTEVVTARFNRGRVYSRLGEIKSALNDFNLAVELAPQFGLTYMERGLCYATLKETSNAKEDFDRALALMPHSQDWILNYLNRAEIHLLDGNHVLALLDMKIAYDLAPNIPLIKEQYEKLQLEAFHAGISLEDFSSQINQLAINYYRKADEHNNKGDLIEALVYYSNAVDYGLVSAEIYFNRGVVNAKLNRLEAAKRDLDQALELKPSHAPALSERGMVLVEMGEEELAMEDYNQALVHEPDYGIAHINKGSLYAKQEKWESALSSLDKGISLEKTPEAFFNRAYVYEQLGKLEEAIVDLKMLETLFPEHKLLSQLPERFAILLNRLNIS